MDKRIPLIVSVILVLLFIVIAYRIPSGFGPALPSTVEMYAIMTGIVVVGVVVSIYGVIKVVLPYPGKISESFAMVIGGLILILGVTVLDFQIHTEALGFNRLTHIFWHLSELVGFIMIAFGLKGLAEVVTHKQ